MPYLSDKSYLAVKVETPPEGTAVRPNVFIPLVSESIETDLAHIADRRFKGMDWKSDNLLRGSRSHAGDLVILGDPDNVGHFLNMILKKVSTSGDATDGYLHTFSVDSPKTYTIEIGKGTYAQRYFGVKGNSLRLEFIDGKLQATLNVRTMGQFSVGTLAEALSGSVTSLKLSQGYDLAPNKGLVASDIIEVEQNDGTYVSVTLTSVDADGITVGFGSISLTSDIGKKVRLKLQTPSYTTLKEPLFQGNTLIGIGADETAATTAAGSKATATPVYEFVFNKLNNLLDVPASGSMEPIKLLPQTREGSISLSQTFENEAQHQKWLDRIKQAITIISKGQMIGIGQERLIIKCYKVKLITNREPLEVGSLIFYRGEFELLYEVAGGVGALAITLMNRTIGTAY